MFLDRRIGGRDRALVALFSTRPRTAPAWPARNSVWATLGGSECPLSLEWREWNGRKTGPQKLSTAFVNSLKVHKICFPGPRRIGVFFYGNGDTILLDGISILYDKYLHSLITSSMFFLPL